MLVDIVVVIAALFFARKWIIDIIPTNNPVGNSIYRILCPNFLGENYWVNYQYSSYLNSYLDNHKIVSSTDCTVRFDDGLVLWVGNWPYAYGSPHKDVTSPRYKESCGVDSKTKIKLKKKVDRFNKKENGNEEMD